MSENVFDRHMLSEKLNKLNSSQQSIESLSSFCITHRKKAKQIVETWDKSFKSAQREQHVSFLYLANDILQNSRRKGNEFVNEFWKVLPSALKYVSEHGDENGKRAASRLVDIWDERRVFGSRGQNLKDETFGKNPPPQLASNGKSSNLIKIVKRDANSLRLKLAVGGMPEKVMTAFQLVHDENVNEDSALNKCEGAVHRFGDLERDIESQGISVGSAVLDEIEEQENVLEQCVNQLEIAETTRMSLVSQLKEALQDQESKLDVIHTQLQFARRQIEHAVNLRQKLASPSLPMITNVENLPSNQVTNLPPSAQTLSSFVATDEENKKAAAAAVAAKLAASTSSAQMLTSVLSSLVAEEAAAITSGFKSSQFPIFSPDKRQKLESATNSETGVNNSSGYFTSLAPPMSQTPFPPLPPPPVGETSAANQFMMGGIPSYVYGATTLPPPPPMPSHIAMALTRPSQQQQQQQQQQTASSGYYRPPGIGFYGQSHHQPKPPPVPRQ